MGYGACERLGASLRCLPESIVTRAARQEAPPSATMTGVVCDGRPSPPANYDADSDPLMLPSQLGSVGGDRAERLSRRRGVAAAKWEVLSHS